MKIKTLDDIERENEENELNEMNKNRRKKFKFKTKKMKDKKKNKWFDFLGTILGTGLALCMLLGIVALLKVLIDFIF